MVSIGSESQIYCQGMRLGVKPGDCWGTKTLEWSLGNVGLASTYVLRPSRSIRVPTISD